MSSVEVPDSPAIALFFVSGVAIYTAGFASVGARFRWVFIVLSVVFAGFGGVIDYFHLKKK